MTTKAIEDLQQIKSIMERSTKFLSLSGWSGIWVGICGLIASSILYLWKNNVASEVTSSYSYSAFNLLALASVTFVIALSGGLYFTIQKTRDFFLKHGNKTLAATLCSAFNRRWNLVFYFLYKVLIRINTTYYAFILWPCFICNTRGYR